MDLDVVRGLYEPCLIIQFPKLGNRVVGVRLCNHVNLDAAIGSLILKPGASASNGERGILQFGRVNNKRGWSNFISSETLTLKNV